jgi:hypothetical protein
MKKIREISEALQQKVESGTDIDGIIDYELHKQEKILSLAKDYIKDIKGGRIDFLYPSLEQIKTAALFKPIDTKYGLTFQSYLENISSGLYNTWDTAVRTGYLTGQTTQQIVKNVMGEAGRMGQLTKFGTMKTLRNSVYANTRTALQSFANETMQRVYKGNEKYFGDGKSKYKYKYLATMIGSMIAGLGGLYYIMDYATGVWSNDGFGDRGWLAIALVIFSVWRPNFAILGSFLFGGLYIVQNFITGIDLGQQELIKMAPYVVTIIILIFISMKKKKETQPPAALGLPYFREDR